MPHEWGSPGGSFSWKGISLPALPAQIYMRQCLSHLLLFACCWNVPFQCLSVGLDGDVGICTSQHSERGQFSKANPFRDMNLFVSRGGLKWIIYSSDAMLSPHEFRWLLCMSHSWISECIFLFKICFSMSVDSSLKLKHPELTGVFLGPESLCGEGSRKAVLKWSISLFEIAFQL